MRSERQRPGKRKIGGDLQGEPIFRLPEPAAALHVPSCRPLVRMAMEEGDNPCH